MQPSHLLSQRDQDPGLPVSWLVHWRQRKFFTWSMQASVRGCFLSSRSFTKFLNCCSSSVYFCEVHLFSNEAKEERKKAKGIGIHTHTHTHTKESVYQQHKLKYASRPSSTFFHFTCCIVVVALESLPNKVFFTKRLSETKRRKFQSVLNLSLSLSVSLSLSLVFPYSLAS